MPQQANESDFHPGGPPASSGRQGPRLRAVCIAMAAVLTAFTIAGCAGAWTDPATNVTNTGATARGLVFATEDATISYWFEYGPTKTHGSETTHRSLVINDRDNHPVSEALTGLDPGTTYHYRACAKEVIAVCSGDRSFTTSGGATQLSITAQPALYPDFDPAISDYVARCDGSSLDMNVVAPANTYVAIDGEEPRNGSFTTEVPLQANQAFSFVRSTGASQSTHHVRCLPADFPQWTFQRFAAPMQQWYVVAVGNYVFALDDRGVPVWWFRDTGRPSDAKYFDDGTFVWGTDRDTDQARYEVHELDGDKLRDLRTVGTETDAHDIQLLDNGNYLMMSYKPRETTVDLSQYPTGPTDATVLDAELQEIDPDDPTNPAWTWNSKDHVGIDEIGHWWEDFVRDSFVNGGYDIVHINSAEVSNSAVIISLRHADGVYKIDRATGEIIWKLGGIQTPESLQVLGDPHASHPLAGQHDARILPDGTLTLFENGAHVSDSSPFHRPPRAVRYEIDEDAGTATLLESVSDADVSAALCCGSARRSDSGSWLVGWGGLINPISEFTAAGVRTFKLNFPGTWSYRAHPIPQGELSRAALRAGMDAQHPR